MNMDSEVSEPTAKKIKSVDVSENEPCAHDTNAVDSKISEQHKGTLELVEKEAGVSTLANDDVLEDDDDSFEFPPDDDITDMLDGVEYSGFFPTITDRYFTSYYKLNVQSTADDIRILIHSNRVCMLTLAPSHSALQAGKRITKVNFKVSDKLDRCMNKVSGKSKHGAQPLQANSNICTISCSNGETYTIKCCLIGKLVEVNEELVEYPILLSEPPHKGGYLAIILPNIKLLDKMKEGLLTQEEYELSILERQKSNILNKTGNTPPLNADIDDEDLLSSLD